MLRTECCGVILAGFTRRPFPLRPLKPLGAADVRAATRSGVPARSPELPGKAYPNACSRSPGAEAAVEPSSRASGCRGSGVIVAGRRLTAIHAGVKEAPEGPQRADGHRGWRRDQLSPAAGVRFRHPLGDLLVPSGRTTTKPLSPPRDVASADLQLTTAQRVPPIADDNAGFVSTTSRVRPGRARRIWRSASRSRPPRAGGGSASARWPVSSTPSRTPTRQAGSSSASGR